MEKLGGESQRKSDRKDKWWSGSEAFEMIRTCGAYETKAVDGGRWSKKSVQGKDTRAERFEWDVRRWKAVEGNRGRHM